MAFGRGGKGRFLVDNAAGTPVDITVFVDSVTWGDFTTGTNETTTFGIDAKTFIAGLSEAGVSCTGKFDAAAGGPDVTLRGLRGLNALTVEWQPEGAGAGKPFRRVEAILESYSSTAPVGDIITFAASWKVSGVETTGALL